MATVRVIGEAETDFNHVFNMRDLIQAVQLIGEWVGKPITEIEMMQYDTETGRPQATGKFKPCEAWNGILWLEGLFNFPRIQKTDPLYPCFKEAVKEGETVQIGDYIVQHISARDEGGLGSGTMANQGGTVPAHIRIIKPRRLQQL